MGTAGAQAHPVGEGEKERRRGGLREGERERSWSHLWIRDDAKPRDRTQECGPGVSPQQAFWEGRQEGEERWGWGHLMGSTEVGGWLGWDGLGCERAQVTSEKRRRM